MAVTDSAGLVIGARYSSPHGAGAGSGIPFYQSKQYIEDRIRALGLPATLPRPVSFMDNFASYNRPARRDGELVLPARFHRVPIEQVRAFDPLLAPMFEFFNQHRDEPPTSPPCASRTQAC